MSKYESVSIRKAMKQIEDNKYFLPHIQRPFVWKQDRNNNQVRKYFDSIMRGYPFGTLMFWITDENIQIRQFIQNYSDDMDVKDTYIKTSDYNNKTKTLVLDGQQRLQSLYIALKGTYNNKEFYIDILSGKNIFWDGKDEIKYNFDYFSKEEVEAKNNKKSYWILLKNIVFSDDESTKQKRAVLAEMEKNQIEVTNDIEEVVEDNISKIINLFSTLELIYYYPIDSTASKKIDYEEILEIFIRVNSGGTVLSKSDLMFSLIKLNWDEAEEEFETLLNSLNQQGAFYFDKDFILKTCLVLIDKRAKYDITKFKGNEGEQNLKDIQDNWEKITESFSWLKDFLSYSRITNYKLLPSYNTLIPIVFYVFNLDNKMSDIAIKSNIQTWLYKALLNGNFSGQADQIIDNCTDIIKKSIEANDSKYPYKDIEKKMKSLNRNIELNENIIDGNIYLILNLIYLYNNQIVNFQPAYSGNLPEIDHIFPKSKMYRTYKYPSNLVNNIGNYMLLDKTLNIKKKNILPEIYIPQAIAEQNAFLKRNLIPDDTALYKPDSFKKFIAIRREKILEVIKEILVYK